MKNEPNYTDVLNEKCNEFRQRAANLMTDTKDKKHCAAGQAYLDCAMEFEALLSERQAAMQGQGVDVDVRDAYRWRHARKILPVEYIEQSQREFESYGLSSSEEENIAADKAIDAAIAQEKQP